MKNSFILFLLWRVLRALAILATAPLWVPAGLAMLAVLTLIILVIEWVSDQRNVWERRA